MTLIDTRRLLQPLFPQGLPPRLQALAPAQMSLEALEDYALNPVLSNRPGASARLAVAQASAPESWQRALQLLWPDAGSEAFFAQGPPGARRMVDSDGGESAVFYLDDLQDHQDAITSPLGGSLVCMCWHHPGGRQTHFTRHQEPPLEQLPPGLAARLTAWLRDGAEGVWGLHWDGTQPCGLLWITESRWRSRVSWNRALLRRWGLPPGWDALERAAWGQGLQIYPDAVELHPEGHQDVTVGFLRRG